MQHNNWTYNALIKILELLPQKYVDGSYIENRITLEEFSPEDINNNFYFVKDVLKTYISCEWKCSGKSISLSAGECCTISMLDCCIEFECRYGVARLFFMAYIHDLDSILSKYLPSKVMGKLHRRQTDVAKRWDKELYGFWHPRSKKYLPLDDDALNQIESEIKDMDEDTLNRLFDSDDVTYFAKHVCYVVELAFGNKKFTIRDFTMEACEKALDLLDK